MVSGGRGVGSKDDFEIILVDDKSTERVVVNTGLKDVLFFLAFGCFGQEEPSRTDFILYRGDPKPARTDFSGSREASAVGVDAEELISREGWSIEILPALGHH